MLQLLGILKAFFVALPDLLKLVQVVQQAIQERETQGKVNDDIKAIRDAIKNKDPEAIRRIFNNSGPGA